MSLFNKLNQIKDLRAQAKDLQNQLAGESVTIEKHGVMINMDGNQKIVKLDINPELLAPDRKEKLQNLLIEIHDDAIKKVQRLMAEKLRASGNFNIPGLS
jgi:nucleoid-associated protein EbfC